MSHCSPEKSNSPSGTLQIRVFSSLTVSFSLLMILRSFLQRLETLRAAYEMVKRNGACEGNHGCAQNCDSRRRDKILGLTTKKPRKVPGLCCAESRLLTLSPTGASQTAREVRKARHLELSRPIKQPRFAA